MITISGIIYIYIYLSNEKLVIEGKTRFHLCIHYVFDSSTVIDPAFSK